MPSHASPLSPVAPRARHLLARSSLLLLGLCAPLLAAPAPQAPKASAELFVRAAPGATAEDGLEVRAALRVRILAARQVLLRHRWAPRVLETRTKTIPAMVRYFDGVLGILKSGGFSYDVAHHALHALGSRALGFTQELVEPDDPEAAGAETAALLEEHADQFPHLLAMLSEVAHDEGDSSLGWCDDQIEFEFGLDLILDGLERRRTTG